MVLPRLAWMNIEMDACAKQKVLEDNHQGSIYTIPHEGWVCSINGKRVIKHLQTALWTHLNGAMILRHWATKQRFREGQAKDIDWEMAAQATQALPHAKQRWVAKLVA